MKALANAPGATYAERLANVVAALEARIAPNDLTIVNDEGPEPTVEYLTDAEADRRAGAEEDRRWRQLP